MIKSSANLRSDQDFLRFALHSPGHVPDGYPGIAFERDGHTFDAGAAGRAGRSWDDTPLALITNCP